MTKWCNINKDRVGAVSDTAIDGWFETSNDNVQQGWWFQNGDVSNTYTVTDMDVIREQRNLELVASDWTQLPDSPLTAEKKAEWATYRQQLRDFPASHTSVTYTLDGTDTAWPTKPA